MKVRNKYRVKRKKFAESDFLLNLIQIIVKTFITENTVAIVLYLSRGKFSVFPIKAPATKL